MQEKVRQATEDGLPQYFYVAEEAQPLAPYVRISTEEEQAENEWQLVTCI